MELNEKYKVSDIEAAKAFITMQMYCEERKCDCKNCFFYEHGDCISYDKYKEIKSEINKNDK